MKSVREILAQEPVFLGAFKSQEDVMAKFFYGGLEQPKGIRVLFAVYEQGSYEGEAFVLFASERKLFEVNGSHCSCFGLEGQWSPEAVNLDALGHRLEEGAWGTYYGSEACVLLKEFIGAA
jgi:hypothetical protein